MLGTKVGAATVFSSLLDTENKIQVILTKKYFLKNGMVAVMEQQQGI